MNKHWSFTAFAFCVLATFSLFGCDQPKQQTAAQQAASTATAQPSNRIIIGHEDTFPPMEFRTPLGELVGYDIDLAQEAFKRMGVEFEYKLLDWSKKDDALLRDKTIDMIWSGLDITEERRQLYGFSEPYLDNRQIIVVTVDSPIRAKADLSNKVVGIQNGASTVPVIERYSGSAGPVAKIQPFPEAAQAMTAMLEHKVDAVVMDETQGRYYISRSPGKFRLLTEDFGTSEFGVAMRKEDTELIRKVNQALADMQADGTERRIYNKWFGENQ